MEAEGRAQGRKTGESSEGSLAQLEFVPTDEEMQDKVALVASVFDLVITSLAWISLIWLPASLI